VLFLCQKNVLLNLNLIFKVLLYHLMVDDCSSIGNYETNIALPPSVSAWRPYVPNIVTRRSGVKPGTRFIIRKLVPRTLAPYFSTATQDEHVLFQLASPCPHKYPQYPRLSPESLHLTPNRPKHSVQCLYHFPLNLSLSVRNSATLLDAANKSENYPSEIAQYPADCL